MNASNSKERTQAMKKAFLILAMMASLLVHAAGGRFCDRGWQPGPSAAWFVNWDRAVAEAKKSGKPIFVLKTGSDWCGWCIRLRKNVLTRSEFEQFAKKNLILLYLDSPRRNPLGEEQKRHNLQVSQRLSLGCGVPNATVVTVDGQKLGTICGGGLALDAYLQKIVEILDRKAAKADERALSAPRRGGCMSSQMAVRKERQTMTAAGGKKAAAELKRLSDMLAKCFDGYDIVQNIEGDVIIFASRGKFAMSEVPRGWHCGDYVKVYAFDKVGLVFSNDKRNSDLGGTRVKADS